MNPESMRLYLNLTTGLHVLAMAAEVAGVFLCLSFRHLSRWTILVAAGFAGLLASGVVSRLASLRWFLGEFLENFVGLIWVTGGSLFLGSIIAVVWGLWMVFNEVQRRLALALEPIDGRR